MKKGYFILTSAFIVVLVSILVFGTELKNILVIEPPAGGSVEIRGDLRLPTFGISGAGSGSGLDADKLDGMHLNQISGEGSSGAGASCAVICNGPCPSPAGGYVLTESVGESGAAGGSATAVYAAGRCAHYSPTWAEGVERMCCYFKSEGATASESYSVGQVFPIHQGSACPAGSGQDGMLQTTGSAVKLCEVVSGSIPAGLANTYIIMPEGMSCPFGTTYTADVSGTNHKLCHASGIKQFPPNRVHLYYKRYICRGDESKLYDYGQTVGGVYNFLWCLITE